MQQFGYSTSTLLCRTADARQAEQQSRKLHPTRSCQTQWVNTKTTRSCAKARGRFIIIQTLLERGPAYMFLWCDDLCRFFLLLACSISLVEIGRDRSTTLQRDDGERLDRNRCRQEIELSKQRTDFTTHKVNCRFFG